MHNLKTVSSRLIRKEYADGINQIAVRQCSGLEPIALSIVAALLWSRSNNMLKINVKSQTNGSLVAHPFGVEVYDCQFTQGWDSSLTCNPPHHQLLKAVWWEYPAVLMDQTKL